jgi:hypothetical protein
VDFSFFTEISEKLGLIPNPVLIPSIAALTPNPSPVGEGSRRLLGGKTVLETGFGMNWQEIGEIEEEAIASHKIHLIPFC